VKKIDIVLKKLWKKLSPDEEVIFQNWINKSDENLALYEKLLQFKNEGNDAHKITELNVSAAWRSVQEKVKSQQKIRSIPFYKSKVLKYAAVLAIGAFFAGYLFKNSGSKNSVNNTSTIVSSPVILPGSDKAILTLDDGTNIEIEKGKKFQNGDVVSTGEELVYNSQIPKKDNIRYNYLTVPRGGQYKIELSDGTKVWLNSESQIKYPVSFVLGETRMVELVYGEAYFDVSPSSENEGSKFIVNNLNQEIEVVGTEFNIKAYKDENVIYTTLVEGQILVGFNDKKERLVPSQQSVLNKSTKDISVVTVDVYNEISWKEGIFVFDGKSLKDIMKVLTRWYDMEVIFMDETVENELFVGVLRKNRDINTVLTSIKNYGTIKDYTIRDKKVILK